MAAPPMHDLSRLADQALDNLVHQFARPLDFLRELVQNAMDAGSPRVDVWVRFNAPGEGEDDGVLEIHVDDWGQGMDQAVIDGQLTRMFSSDKEGDLTKIGKFGIGFTSIFAVDPEAVLLRTGRHGEAWELLFHRDRSFDKVRLEDPVDGTRVTLFKRMAPDAVEGFVRECRWTLTYWCEHSDTPVRFEDRTGAGARGGDGAAEAAADPFAPFAAVRPGASPSDTASGGEPPASAGPQVLTTPLGIEADPVVEAVVDGVHVVAGYGTPPRYGFYNGGLTLLSTRNPDVLGEHANVLAPVTFKVKYDRLEHTLTRDNVLQDAHWRKAMGVLLKTVWTLRKRLVERAGEAVAAGEDPAPWYELLARECRAADLHRAVQEFSFKVMLRDRRGEVLSLRVVEVQEERLGAVLLDPGPGALGDALEREGWRLLPDDAALVDLLHACHRRPTLALRRRPRQVLPAGELFMLPEVVERNALPPVERRLMGVADDLLAEVVGRRVRLACGDFGGAEAAAELPLVVEGEAASGVCRRPRGSRWRLAARMRRRLLLVNRHHATYRALAAAAADQPVVAALGLLQGVLTHEGVEGERCYRGLLRAACEALPPGGAPAEVP